MKDFFSRLPFFQKKDTYKPWYSDYSDYNTNAKSYYDYLSKFNKLIRTIVDFLNRSLNRNIEFHDTNSISFSKKGDWIDNKTCEDKGYDDIIRVSSDVKISLLKDNIYLDNIYPNKILVENGSTIKNDGVWSPDYFHVLKAISDEIGTIKEDIKNIKNDIVNINKKIETLNDGLRENDKDNNVTRLALQKILENLNKTGTITNYDSNNISSYNFVNGRDIASGNINIFGGTPDGGSFIRTNKGKSENDITAGVDE